MGLEISAAPLGSPINGESPSLPAQSPRSPKSGLDSPWIDPASPNLGTSPIFDRKHASSMGLLGSNSNPAENANTGLGLHGSSREKKLQEKGHHVGIFKRSWKMFKKFVDKFVKNRWSMVGFLLFGVVCALGHHFLYACLEGQEARDQDWWHRLGQLISFASKACFVASVVMAQQQMAWSAVRKTDYSVEAVGSLFGSTHAVIELLSVEAWRKTLLAMFLSLSIWASPLIIIFSTATLVVSPGHTVEGNSMCPSVRTLNFSQEASNRWDSPRQARNSSLIGISLSLWERTGASFDDDDNVDYWSSPSSQFGAIANNVFTSNQAVQRENVSLDICGTDANCSTVIHFVGPGYKCDSVTPTSGILIDDYAGVKAPFNMTELAPEGNHTYFARTKEGDYGAQIELENGKPTQQPPYPDNLGAFKADPIMWLGYTTVKNMSARHPQAKNLEGWDDAYTPAVLACEHYVVNYTVKLNYMGGLQTYEVTHRDYMHKVIDTIYQETVEDPADGLLDGVVAVPEDNYVLPAPNGDMERYRLTAAYYSFGRVLREMLDGEIRQPNHISRSGVLISRLMDKHDYIAVPNLQHEVRRLCEDLLISLLSNPQLLVVSWAADSSELSGTGSDGPKYPCERYRSVNKYSYRWEALCAIYALSFVVASVAVISGLYSMRKDGVGHQRPITFAAIVEATNNLILREDRDKEREIRYSHPPSGEDSADRVHGFVFVDGDVQKQDNCSRSALDDKPAFTNKETPVSPIAPASPV